MRRNNEEYRNPYDLSQTTGNTGVGKFRLTIEERKSNKRRNDDSIRSPYDLSHTTGNIGVGKFRLER